MQFSSCQQVILRFAGAVLMLAPFYVAIFLNVKAENAGFAGLVFVCLIPPFLCAFCCIFRLTPGRLPRYATRDKRERHHQMSYARFATLPPRFVMVAFNDMIALLFGKSFDHQKWAIRVTDE